MRAQTVALSAILALCAVHAPRAAGVGTLVYVVHQDSWGWGAYDYGGLALMQPDGSNQVQLTNGTADTEPAWSPDGVSIAFSRSSDIYVIPAVGGTPLNLTNNPASDGAPAWSPDGQRIAFASDRGGPLELYVMNADGSGIVRLAGSLASAGRPAWAPDGSRIAFNCGVESGNIDICAVALDGSTVARLTTAPGRDSDAAWSPDGATIAFATERYETIATSEDPDWFPVAEIALMNPDGSSVRPLSAGLAAEYPSWSPDGAQISFDVTEYFNYPLAPFVQVATMNGDGTGPVTVAPGRGGSAAWRPAAGNLPPVALFSASCSAHTCTFDAAPSADPDGSIASYAWSFGDGTTGWGAMATHQYQTGEPVVVTLTVSDDTGTSASGSYTVEPNNRPSAWGRATCDGVTCVFDGSQSYDRDGTVASHVWEFGDGTAAAGSHVTHAYSAPGIYLATITVADNEGATATHTFEAIASAPPIASFTFTCVRLACVFDGSASIDPDGTIADYSWGSYGSGPILHYTYAYGGTYGVQLRVRDNHGLSAVQYQLVTVAPTLPPVASFTSACSNLGCVFDASTSSATEGAIQYYEWQFGDGVSGYFGVAANHVYAAPGTYSVVLTVLDTFGVSDEQRTNVTVTSVPGHVGDIDGVVNKLKASWAATVTIEIHGDTHTRLAGVRVTGLWSNGVAGECVTSTDGRCVVSLGTIPNQTRSLSFSVTSVLDVSSYRPDRNHDPDGNSDGTTITVKRP